MCYQLGPCLVDKRTDEWKTQNSFIINSYVRLIVSFKLSLTCHSVD